MGRRFLSVCALLALSWETAPSSADDPRAPRDQALAFFERDGGESIVWDLAALRPPPVGQAMVRQAISMLPARGALTPTLEEARALAALRPILAFHQREDVFVLKVIDLPQAVIGLHARAVLLMSRPVFRLLTEPELHAVVAHEVGHDFFWDEYISLRERRDARGRQALELRCDGIAVLTLVAFGREPTALLTALRKLVEFNEQLGATADQALYPPLSDRARFVTQFMGRLERARGSTLARRGR